MVTNLLQWFLSALVIIIAAFLVPGVEVTLIGALLVAVVLGVFSIFIKPLLVALTLPINVLTLGLFSLVINGFLIYVAALIVPGFSVANFWWAILYGLVLAIINVFFGIGILDREKKTN